MKMEDITSLEELKAVKVLGGGAMGTVFLVIDEKHDKRSLALKVISKSVMMKKEEGLRRTEVEFDILSSSALQHPFLSPFLGRLETEKIIAFLGEYCPAGDLNNLRHEQAEKTFSESVIRFLALKRAKDHAKGDKETTKVTLRVHREVVHSLDDPPRDFHLNSDL